MTRARLAAFALVCASLTGCASSEVGMGRTHFLKAGEVDEGEATYLGLPLRSGQVILSEAGSPYSLFFSLAAETYTDFTHAAILVMENGEPWVYEMTGEYKPGIDERVTDGIEGGCRRIELIEYSRAYLYLEIYDPPQGVDGEAVARWAQEQHRKGVEFDAYFDYGEHEKLFCTEFVQMGLEAGGGGPLQPVKVREHASLRRLLEWLAVPHETGVPAGLLADPTRSVAALGQLPSLGAARGYFAAKKELHRRFTPDQQLGNIFILDGAELSLRRQLLIFMERATNQIHEADPKLPDAEVDRIVQGIAAEMFGVAAPVNEEPREDS